jgi:dTDP-glucose 4,6-dehydratase
VFVTGGGGFIGSAVIRHLLDDTQACVVNIDKLTYVANLDAIPQVAGNERSRFARVDICDGAGLRRLFERHRPNYVMNLAAESHVDRSSVIVHNLNVPCIVIDPTEADAPLVIDSDAHLADMGTL